ncbi:carbohydrate ABC transporter permease [Paenibacillus sp. SYP-B4298]|uniref:carbohydrate ABC transporter permease n=1 Tax=Paenibacillus sp. SYP-B4298 TaxID=2996034 RepID=UPI0022DD10E1|nr:carbohydrate ABC transporter permease [Paenibacillus sp. SYP-B4298]
MTMLMRISSMGRIVFLTIFGAILIYPILWMVSASFKPMHEIFSTVSLLPSQFQINSYINGWKGTGQFGFSTFFFNSFLMVVPTVIATVISSLLVAYGFARFRFPGKNVLFSLMIATLMLPNAVIIIPSYLLFRNFGWLDTYWTFIIPAAFATYPFFIFMMVQFLRGLPRDLDESAVMDGCNSFKILTHILLPLSKPAVVSAAVFQFIWTWNDFFNSLIFINSVKKYPVSLGLRMSLDTSSISNWDQVMAMSVVSIIPCLAVFFMAQRYFVEGIATTGIKG